MGGDGRFALPAKDFQGRPAFKKGKDYGAFVWHDEKGHQVRFTTKRRKHRFKGSVFAEGGGGKPLNKSVVHVGAKGKHLHKMPFTLNRVKRK